MGSLRLAHGVLLEDEGEAARQTVQAIAAACARQFSGWRAKSRYAWFVSPLCPSRPLGTPSTGGGGHQCAGRGGRGFAGSSTAVGGQRPQEQPAGGGGPGGSRGDADLGVASSAEAISTARPLKLVVERMWGSGEVFEGSRGAAP